jgi:hypothetical protein
LQKTRIRNKSIGRTYNSLESQNKLKAYPYRFIIIEEAPYRFIIIEEAPYRFIIIEEAPYRLRIIEERTLSLRKIEKLNNFLNRILNRVKREEIEDLNFMPINIEEIEREIRKLKIEVIEHYIQRNIQRQREIFIISTKIRT